VAGRSPSTTRPKVRIRDAASVRVDHASPAQAQSAAPVRAPPRPPGLFASVHLQLRSVLSGLVRGGRPPSLSSSAGGRATTQHARSLFVSIIARGTTHCATSPHAMPHARVRFMLIYPHGQCASYRAVRLALPAQCVPKRGPGAQGSAKGSVASETHSQSGG
jgi:hypothetical protein